MASNFKSVIAANVGLTVVDVYTVPSLTTTTIIGLALANTSTSQVTCTVTLTKGATTVNIVKNAIVPVGSSLVLCGGEQKIVMETGNKFSVVSSAATSIDVIVSVLELS